MSSHPAPRQRWNINRDWGFTRGDIAGAESAAFDDSGWQRVGLPHCFDLPYFRTPEFFVGVGWYRKRIGGPETEHGLVARATMESPVAPAASPCPDSHHWLEFDGAFQVADVFVNGRHVGSHRGGYTGFAIDCPLHARENVIAVRVSNEWNPQLAPRAGEHIFSGGLYRDIHLLAVDHVHIVPNGVGIATPQVSRESASVRVTSEVRNVASASSRCTVRHTVIDPAGAAICAFEQTQSIQSGATVMFDQASPPIGSPRLWHPDHPHLYAIRTQVLRDGRDEACDIVETPFGFRFFEWTPDRGFFLNGEHLYLRGANAHQDHAGWGIGITRAACRRDVKLIKDAGFNFVRGAHYPHHPAFARACDEMGLLFWSENAFWGKGGFGPEGYWNASAYPVNEDDFEPFEQHAKQSLREMIRINRNSPSIVAWSMTNEAFFTYNLDRAKSLISTLVALSHELDPTRPAAIGGAQRGGVDRLGDIAGYNGDGARLFIDPGVPNMVSEYGAISKPHDAFDPFYGELQRERFPWRAGEAIWCGFDYGSIAGKQGLKGIVDHQRLPKRSWHWYRRQYLGIDPPPPPQPGEPRRLRLVADKTAITGTDATDDVQLVVTICDANGNHISNSPPVTLRIESGPGEFPTGRSITFDANGDIRIIDGAAAIALRSYHGGQTLVRATSPGLEDATITLTTIGEPQFVPGVILPAPDRPYQPPPVSEAALAAMRNVVNVALNRPSRASSEAEHHPARFANDGDDSSSWRALGETDADPNPWWQVDLEGFYQISGSRLAFPADANYRFRIDLSNDGQSWMMAVDRTATDNIRAIRNDIYPPGATARYVRITLTDVPRDVPAGLCEVRIFGVLSTR